MTTNLGCSEHKERNSENKGQHLRRQQCIRAEKKLLLQTSLPSVALADIVKRENFLFPTEINVIKYVTN